MSNGVGYKDVVGCALSIVDIIISNTENDVIVWSYAGEFPDGSVLYTFDSYKKVSLKVWDTERVELRIDEIYIPIEGGLAERLYKAVTEHVSYELAHAFISEICRGILSDIARRSDLKAIRDKKLNSSKKKEDVAVSADDNSTELPDFIY